MFDNRVLGVPIEGEGWDQILGRLDRGEELWIVTANPEILLEARKDLAYRETLKKADLRTVDGIGLFFVLIVLRRKIKRITGIDLAEHLLQYAWKKELRVGLFGGEFGEAEAAAKHIRDGYPEIRLHVEQAGSVTPAGEEDTATEEARHRMTVFSPHILLVALGHPRQERWIEAHRADFPELRGVIGVGGTFNYWAGFSKRPPLFIRSIGLEWLWRVVREPRRWRRILRAVFVFPLYFLVDRLRPVR